VQFVNDELDAPAAFALDAGKDLKDLFLFAAVGEAFSGDSEAAKGCGCDATSKEMSVVRFRDLIKAFWTHRSLTCATIPQICLECETFICSRESLYS
jgi:hypothetical protein